MAYPRRNRCEHYYQNRIGSNQHQNRVTCVQCGKVLFLHYFRECDESLVRFADTRGTPMTVQDLVHQQFRRSTPNPTFPLDRVAIRTIEVPVIRERVIEIPVVTERVIEKRIEVPVVQIVEEKSAAKCMTDQETQTEDEDWTFLTPETSQSHGKKMNSTDKCVDLTSAEEC
jgi:hypothetical protein